MPRRSNRRDDGLRERISSRRSREQSRYLLLGGLAFGGLILVFCLIIGVIVVKNIARVEGQARSAPSGASSTQSEDDTAMWFVLADPDSFPDAQAVAKELGRPGHVVDRGSLASIAIAETDEVGRTSQRSLESYMSLVPRDATIYHWSRPNQDLYVAFGKDPHFPGHRMLKGVYSDRQSGKAKVKTRG